MSTHHIEVHAWGHLVGVLAASSTRRAYVFEYDEAWRRRHIELAPLTMPTTAEVNNFVFPNLAPETYWGLPSLIADALPDRFGNTLINAYMADRGVSRESITVLDRLAYMGRRGMGALEFHPAAGSVSDSREPLAMKSLVEQARLAVRGRLGPGETTRSGLARIIRVGTSAGGARAKAVIAWNPHTGKMRSGQFAAPEGFEHWLLKFDGVGKDLALGEGGHYGRVEYAYHLMARAVGIQMSDCRLEEEGGRCHFMTRRFDREQGHKHHVQSLCALSELDFNQQGTHAYAQAFMALDDLGLDQEARDELFRRLAFNVATANCDDHTKNLSFLLKEGGKWGLAPAFDVTHAYNPVGEWASQHQMSVAGKFRDISHEDLLREAERFLVREPRKILTRVNDVVGAFGDYARQAGVPEAVTHAIRGHFVRV